MIEAMRLASRMGRIGTETAFEAAARARALERAEQFYVGIGPKPQPTAKWLGGDRLAYSFDGKAPWTVFEASTARVLESESGDAACGVLE